MPCLPRDGIHAFAACPLCPPLFYLYGLPLAYSLRYANRACTRPRPRDNRQRDYVSTNQRSRMPRRSRRRARSAGAGSGRQEPPVMYQACRARRKRVLPMHASKCMNAAALNVRCSPLSFCLPMREVASRVPCCTHCAPSRREHSIQRRATKSAELIPRPRTAAAARHRRDKRRTFARGRATYRRVHLVGVDALLGLLEAHRVGCVGTGRARQLRGPA